MIKLVNEDFFSFKTGKTSHRGNRVEVQTRLVSNAPIYKKLERIGEDGVRYREIEFPLFRIYSPTENYARFPMLLKQNWTKTNGKFFMTGIANRTVTRDSLVVGIAFPFDGLVKPIEPSPDYRILSGVIGHSDWSSILYEDPNGKVDRYHKILYLIIAPDTGLFDPTHRRHKNKITMCIDTFMTVKPEAKEGTPKSELPIPSKSIQRQMRIEITKDNVTFNIVEQEVDYVNMRQFSKLPVWKVYEIKKQFDKKPARNYNNKSAGKSSHKSKQSFDKKPYTKERDKQNKSNYKPNRKPEKSSYNSKDRQHQKTDSTSKKVVEKHSNEASRKKISGTRNKNERHR